MRNCPAFGKHKGGQDSHIGWFSRGCTVCLTMRTCLAVLTLMPWSAGAAVTDKEMSLTSHLVIVSQVVSNRFHHEISELSFFILWVIIITIKCWWKVALTIHEYIDVYDLIFWLSKWTIYIYIIIFLFMYFHCSYVVIVPSMSSVSAIRTFERI